MKEEDTTMSTDELRNEVISAFQGLSREDKIKILVWMITQDEKEEK